MKNYPPGVGNRAKRYRKPSKSFVGGGIRKRKTKRSKRKQNERERNKQKNEKSL